MALFISLIVPASKYAAQIVCYAGSIFVLLPSSILSSITKIKTKNRLFSYLPDDSKSSPSKSQITNV